MVGLEEVGQEGGHVMMLPTSQRYIEQAFSPQVFSGMPSMQRLGSLGVKRGMGMTMEEAAAAISAGAKPGSEAYEAYYGSGGFYSQAESVQRAAEEVDNPVQITMPTPRLYAQEECAVTDQACVARNSLRQQANFVLLRNANNDYLRKLCEQSNIASGTDRNCDTQYPIEVVPYAPGTIQDAVCNGGQCYAAILGDAKPSGQTTTGQKFTEQYTSTGTPRTGVTVGVPNQNVAPRPQAGEVPAADSGATAGTAEATGAAVGGGLLAGVSNTTLMIGAAALVAVLLLKGK